MSEEIKQAPNQLNIEISEEVAEGHYTNLAIITHSHAEFVIDFVNVMPGTPPCARAYPVMLDKALAMRAGYTNYWVVSPASEASWASSSSRAASSSALR